jgi:hypothetical protein
VNDNEPTALPHTEIGRCTCAPYATLENPHKCVLPLGLRNISTRFKVRNGTSIKVWWKEISTTVHLDSVYTWGGVVTNKQPCTRYAHFIYIRQTDSTGVVDCPCSSQTRPCPFGLVVHARTRQQFLAALHSTSLICCTKSKQQLRAGLCWMGVEH